MLRLPLILLFILSVGLILVSQANAAPSLIAPERVCKTNKDRATRSQKIRAMVCMTNYARRKSGLRAYRLNSRLKRSAYNKSRDIKRCNSFSHSACGRDFAYWIKRSGYIRPCYRSIGENIAWGSSSGGLSSVRSIFIAWMNSPGHRRAILDKNFRDLGINFYEGRFKGYRATIWTQHFGLKC